MDFLADANVARPETFAGYAALAPEDLASLYDAWTDDALVVIGPSLDAIEGLPVAAHAQGCVLPHYILEFLFARACHPRDDVLHMDLACGISPRAIHRVMIALTAQGFDFAVARTLDQFVQQLGQHVLENNLADEQRLGNPFPARKAPLTAHAELHSANYVLSKKMLPTSCWQLISQSN